MKLVKTVIVSGSSSSSSASRTLTLAKRILQALERHVDVDPHVIELADVGSEIGRALVRRELSESAEGVVRLLESAELVIAATPVYRGSYSGHFKHLFDLIDQDALIDVPVILAATGGGDRHCLIIEHLLRPLFGFLQSYTVPTGIYAAHADFKNGELTSEIVLSRIGTAARQAARLLPKRLPGQERRAEPIATELPHPRF
jgi:FMN reductase